MKACESIWNLSCQILGLEYEQHFQCIFLMVLFSRVHISPKIPRPPLKWGRANHSTSSNDAKKIRFWGPWCANLCWLGCLGPPCNLACGRCCIGKILEWNSEGTSSNQKWFPPETCIIGCELLKEWTMSRRTWEKSKMTTQWLVGILGFPE